MVSLPMRALRVVETLGARLSKRLICYFLDLTDSSLIPAVQNIISSVFFLLALIGAIEKRNDLGAGATISGLEGNCGRAFSHAAFYCPRHSVTL